MLLFFEQIDGYTEQEFENLLPQAVTYVLDIIGRGSVQEIQHIASVILAIQNPVQYVRVVEALFIANQQQYIQLVTVGSKEIAKRRKELAG